MKNIFLIILTAFLTVTCNSSTEEKKSDQSSSKGDNAKVERSLYWKKFRSF